LYGTLAHREIELCLESWYQLPEVKLFESVSYLVHRVIVATLMGPDFYEHHVDELFDLLRGMGGNIGKKWNVLLPEWVPHRSARRLRKARDRVCQIFEERLEQRQKHPEEWVGAMDYISYTLRDASTAHLKKYYGAHHTLLMFAAHTSTVATVAWTVLEVRTAVKLWIEGNG
jgi:sterol 14alpha-demethylase